MICDMRMSHDCRLPLIMGASSSGATDRDIAEEQSYYFRRNPRTFALPFDEVGIHNRPIIRLQMINIQGRYSFELVTNLLTAHGESYDTKSFLDVQSLCEHCVLGSTIALFDNRDTVGYLDQRAYMLSS